MKIRTGFVTNSSSYSSTELKIRNPLLLEIFRKYKEFGFDFDYINWNEDGEIIYKNDETGERLYKQDLGGILEVIIAVIENYDRSEFDLELRDELIKNKEELTANMESAQFSWLDNSYGSELPEFGDVSAEKFRYSKGNECRSNIWMIATAYHEKYIFGLRQDKENDVIFYSEDVFDFFKEEDKPE